MGKARGRPPKPVDQHRLDGTYRADRHQSRYQRPIGKRLARPKHLAGPARKLWDHVVPDLQTAGIVTSADRPLLEAMCEWYAIYHDELNRVRAASSSFARRKAIVTARMAWTEVSKIAACYGLDPISRERLKAPPEEETDPLLNLLDRQQQRGDINN